VGFTVMQKGRVSGADGSSQMSYWERGLAIAVQVSPYPKSNTTIQPFFFLFFIGSCRCVSLYLQSIYLWLVVIELCLLSSDGLEIAVQSRLRSGAVAMETFDGVYCGDHPPTIIPSCQLY